MYNAILAIKSLFQPFNLYLNNIKVSDKEYFLFA